jgi:signal transduction histidine kinase
MVGRIQLFVSLAMVILGCVCLLNLLVVFPAFQTKADIAGVGSSAQAHQYVWRWFVQELGLLLSLLLLQCQRTQRFTNLVFIWASWSLLLLPQIQASLRGEGLFDPTVWFIVYMAQAILIPVRWRVHLASQVTMLAFFVGMLLFGLQDPNLVREASFSETITGAVYISVGFRTLFVCFIADLGVYLYERLLRREFELRQQLRLFLHAVSHDLRNPVLGTMMVLKNLRNSTTEVATIPTTVLDRMIDGGDRQLQLIDSLLEVHHVESHGIQLHCQCINIRDVATTVIHDLLPVIQDNCTTVTLAIAEDTPCVVADPLQMYRVYENLMTHSLHYNPPGITLRLDAELYGDRLRLIVADNGQGLSAHQCRHLFNLYTTGPDARQTLSTGLELYICQHIIEAHGGAINVISDAQKGCIFTFDLAIATTPSHQLPALS